MRKEEVERLQRDLQRRRILMESQIASLQAEYDTKAEEIKKLINQEKQKETAQAKNRQEMARLRKADKENAYEEKTY